MKYLVCAAIIGTLLCVCAGQLDRLIEPVYTPQVHAEEPEQVDFDEWDRVVLATHELARSEAETGNYCERLHRDTLMYGVPRDVREDYGAFMGGQVTPYDYHNPYRRWRVEGDKRWRAMTPHQRGEEPEQFVGRSELPRSDGGGQRSSWWPW